MTARNLQNLKDQLEGTGFVQKDEHLYSWDNEESRLPDRKELPWSIQNWSIEELDSRLKQVHFDIELRRDAFAQNLEELMREKFESFRSLAVVDDNDKGVWLLFEFLDKNLDADQSRLIEEEDLQKVQLPHGLAGLHLSVIQALGQMSLFMTKHFLLGNVPGALFIEFPPLLTEAFFGQILKQKSHYNMFVSMAAAEDIKAAIVEICDLPTDLWDQLKTEVMAADNPYHHISLTQDEQLWSLTWNQKDELPELVVPPIEVLEQREVARRFQRLDELILLEDYAAAVQQCREFLQKYPSSLYLIRRWVFLSLWSGQVFEKNYLDILSRNDPGNLLTLSLWIRKSIAEGQSDTLLESLSRLGNHLGQQVLDFGSLDITSLTLPEMLGDAWNSRDDQRAVACYERVLQTRGEVPRILVKLIRLMRDVDDSVSEESYMDRLLSCEVPVRTRAAIYYRLAEIKEDEDQEEAVKWALKSWQTNRSQMKYAMLAAKLLIFLQRAHEAVHVLVENCELLPKDASLDARFELEIKIAQVWMHELNRADLAQERLDRAREVSQGRPEYMLKILPLAQEVGDSIFLAELLMRALEAAIQNGERDHADRLVKTLLTLADKIQDGSQVGHIYSLILTCSMLDIYQIESILQRPNLSLPYDKILAAMDAQVENLELAKRGHYLLLMGDITKQYLQDEKRVQSYYERALGYGEVNVNAFEYLDRTYSALGLHKQRNDLLKGRLKTADVEDRKSILRELYTFDEAVSHEEKDHYALELFALDHDDLAPLEERIGIYEMESKAAPIHRLADEVMKVCPLAEVRVPILQKMLQSLENVAGENRFAAMHDILQKLQNSGYSKVEAARQGLSLLWPDPQKTYVAFYLEILLEAGEVPDLDPEKMLEILSDGEMKVQLMLRLAGASSDVNKKIHYERQAFRIARNLPGLLPTKIDILTRLSVHSPLQEDEIAEYAKAVRQTGRTQTMLRVLGEQIPRARTDVMRDRLFQLAFEFMGTVDADTLDLDLLHEAISFLSPEQQIKIKNIWLERVGFNVDLHNKEYAAQVLRDKNFWHMRHATSLLLRQVIETWKDQNLAKSIVGPMIKSLIDEDQADHLQYYLNLLMPTGLITQSLSLASFEYYADRDEAEAMERFWLHSVKLLESAEQTLRLLDYSKGVLGQNDRENLLTVWVSHLVEHNAMQSLPDSVQRNLRLFYAENLLDSPKDHRKALTQFEILYTVDPEDVRTWSPLILLYRENQSDTDLYEILHSILPKLRRDPSPLQAYDLDLDSLEADLLSIGERLGLKPETDVEEAPLSQQGASEFGGAQDVDDEGEASDPGYVKTSLNVLDLDVKGSAPRRAEPVEAKAAQQETKVRNERPAAQEQKTAAAFDFGNLLYQGKSPAEMKGTAKVPAEEKELGESKAKVESPQSTLVRPKLELEPQSAQAPQSSSGLDLDVANVADAATANSWKEVATQGRASPGLTLRLLAQPLPDLLEQHLAVQTSAIFEDNIKLLDAYRYPVWRDPAAIFYDLKWTERMTRDMFHPGIKSPLAKLLKTLHPIVVDQFISQMNLKGISDRIKMKPEDIQKNRRPIDWKDEVIQRSGLRFYVKFMTDNEYTVYHLPKLEDRFQFDFDEHELYIDRDYYLSVAPSHLYHRVSFLIRAVSVDYYPYLHLSPTNDLFPFLMKCRRSLEANRVDNFKRMLGMEKDALKTMLSDADREYLDALFNEVGALSPDKITKIISVYVDQIYRLNLAETLDLVGIIESISNSDLLQEKISPLALVNQSASIRNLMSFAAELKFPGNS